MKFKIEKVEDLTAHGVWLADFVAAIPDGETNAISTRELAHVFDIHPRVVTSTVAYLRKHGIVIASSGAGYFFPASDDELRHFVAQMHSRMREIKLATISAEKMLERRERRDG